MRPYFIASFVVLSVTACDRPISAPMQPASATPSVQANGTALAPDQLAQLKGVTRLVDAWIASRVLTLVQGRLLLQPLSQAMALYFSGNSTDGQALLGVAVARAQALTQSGALTVSQANQFSTPVRSVVNNEILFSQIALGDTHSCGLTEGGYAYCWGDNRLGQLGSAGGSSTRAVLVSAAQTFARIGVGYGYSCALAAGGASWCWGGNISGQLGDGTTTDRAIPGLVGGGHSFTSLSLSYALACGSVGSGDVYCWGSGGRLGTDLGGLGGPAPATCGGYYATPWLCSTSPVKVTGSIALSAPRTGDWYGCALASGGAAHCWGWNQFYQLGDGTRNNAFTPVPVSGGISFAALETGAVHTCGLDGAGTAYCWGGWAFNFGQLGNGTFAPAPTPSMVSGGRVFRLIRPAVGNNIFSHTCALDGNDEAWCWGANSYGQLAGTALDVCSSGTPFPCSSTPIRSAVGKTFADVSTGSEATCGLTRTREAWCWGLNYFGQLGNGTTLPTSIPTRVLR